MSFFLLQVFQHEFGPCFSFSVQREDVNVNVHMDDDCSNLNERGNQCYNCVPHYNCPQSMSLSKIVRSLGSDIGNASGQLF